ncbi:MAG TPA: N-acetylmuramoyl-L-alanine amidase [Rhodospirillaceae bacterium]|nr:N-acetylmuramoyl-L-alanine amidase [Rhodospirillaceae bacterium]
MSEDEEELYRRLENPSRRSFLRLGLALPFLSASFLTPTSLLAASAVTPLKWSQPVRPTTKPKAPRLIVIDPGHGGHDPGAIGHSGTKEKHVALDIARHMARVLSKEEGITVKLTRDRDKFLSLKERVRIGRETHADMFFSIHADSAPNRRARGLSAYTLSEKASDKFASMLAEKENSADLIGGVELPSDDQDVADILCDLAARRTRNTAQRVKVGFIKGIGRRWRLLEEPMRAANFAVLRSPEVPAMLVETGFLSNKRDEALLSKKKSRHKIASLMAQEITFLLRSPLFG